MSAGNGQSSRHAYTGVITILREMFIEGFEKGLTPTDMFSAMTEEMKNNPELTREKAINLLVVALLQQARAIHEGDRG